MPIKVNVSSISTVLYPKQDFILGELVFMDIDIHDTGTKRKVRRIVFHLVQYVWYHSDTECGRIYNKKKKNDILTIPIITSESIYNVPIRIPPTIPTTLEYFDIIKIRYALKIYVDNEKNKCPIVIGDCYQ